MAGVESSKRDLVVRPGQKNAFGTVLAVRLSPELGLDKACPRECGGEPSLENSLKAREAADLRARSAVGCMRGLGSTQAYPDPGYLSLAAFSSSTNCSSEIPLSSYGPGSLTWGVFPTLSVR